jgi:leucyl-tRNA synthetase
MPIIPIIEGQEISTTSHDAKEGKMINSGILNGLEVKDAIRKINDEIEGRGLGSIKVNYRLRDAIFSRQRYWGEPFPIYYKDGVATALSENELPLTLPEISEFLPTEDGQPPLGRATDWTSPDGFPFELSTMPGFAGSSGYYLRYMDPQNNEEFVSKEANEYWQDVDLYIGGTEHAVGHLIYSRFWNKFLYDIGMVCKSEPFRKLVNQGMIQGRSNFVYRVKGSQTFVSYNLRNDYDTTPLHVDVNIVQNDVLDTEAFRNWLPEYANAEFILEDGKYICGWEVEKMSKSKYNVVNPDRVVEEYGADTLRMYEMFLGPLEQSKPWDMNGIEGVHKFLRKFWRNFYNVEGQLQLTDEEATDAELKILHKTIKKISDDIERFSFNTSVSAFMIALNELAALKCKKRSIFEPLVILVHPFAPHITEELWIALGNTAGAISDAEWPEFDEDVLKEANILYPVSFNGRKRCDIEISAAADAAEVERFVLASEIAQKWLEGKTPKKIIVVPGRIVNIVL